MNHQSKRWQRFFQVGQGASLVQYAIMLSVTAAASLAVLAASQKAKDHYDATRKGMHSLTAANSGHSSGELGEHGGTASPTATQTLFADDFAGPADSQPLWSFFGSGWQVSGGKLQAGPGAGWNELRGYAIGSSFGDGTVTLDATLNGGWGYGIFFHVSANPAKERFNGYAFQYDKGYGTGAFVLRKWIHGTEIAHPLAVSYPASSYPWYGVTRHIEITTQGSVITVKVDGQTVIQVADSSYASGGIGMRLWNNPSATFANVTVTVPAKP